jgi:hypothetical protein
MKENKMKKKNKKKFYTKIRFIQLLLIQTSMALTNKFNLENNQRALMIKHIN